MLGNLKNILLIFCVVSFGLVAKTSSLKEKSDLPTVAIFLTGGTIAEKTDPKTGASVPVTSGKEMINAIPELKKLANYKIIEFSNIDSSQMTPEIWLKLSKKVDEVLEDSSIKGAVITHGTDTMVEGAFFLDITLKTKKSVVFTGAMRNSSDPYPDGPPNLINSVIQVLSPKSNNWGVTVNMNQYIQSAYWAEKTQTTNPQTFESGEKGFLGYVYNNMVFRYNDTLYHTKIPLPKKMAKVNIIVDYAGSSGDLLKYAVDSGADGIVVQSVGAGNVNQNVFEAIKYALSKGVVVAITTQVSHGCVVPAYGDLGGGKTLVEAGAMLAGGLHTAKVQLMLMLAIPQYKNDKAKMKDLLDSQFCR